MTNVNKKSKGNGSNSESCPLLYESDSDEANTENINIASSTAVRFARDNIRTKSTTTTTTSAHNSPATVLSLSPTTSGSTSSSWAIENIPPPAAIIEIRKDSKNVSPTLKTTTINKSKTTLHSKVENRILQQHGGLGSSGALKATGATTKYVTWSWRLWRRKKPFLALIGVALFVLFMNSNFGKEEVDERIPVVHYSHVPGMKGYLVWSDFCQMPNIDPYQPEIMIFFKREKYKSCSNIKPLTNVTYDEESQSYMLQIDEESKKSYSKSDDLRCCYQAIERNSTGLKADESVSLSECKSFSMKIIIPPTIDNILVKCHVKKKQVYINGHAMMPERTELRERLNAWKLKDNNNSNNQQTESTQPPSVLLIGIDSISRINLIRAMPKTAQYLYDNEWFEMSGYNKIDDNTFPNLMALLTGLNKTTALDRCQPTELRGLDSKNCSFIWNTFRDHGYVTAYAEDETMINTFNYGKVGFERPPVDYYLRPFLISAESHLPVKKKSNLLYCLGYKHSADFVYDYALELASRYKNDPFFGVFWTNTFSHNAISDCSSMDGQMVMYLKKFAAIGALNSSVIVFFSDHGMRFGPTRKTLSGHLEERLPFVFLWLPQHLKQAHPEFVNALSVNKNRLTNPFDLHMTLKNLLAITGRVQDERFLRPAEDCPNCQSLLMPVPHNRSCAEIAIEDHWCTCIPYQSVYKDSKLIHKITKSTIAYINDYVVNFKNGSYASKCVPLEFGNVDSAYRAQHFMSSVSGRNDTYETYRIIFYTKPNKGLFEATIRYYGDTKNITVTGEISRLNTYSSDSDCVGDGGAKKYCSCRRKKSS